MFKSFSIVIFLLSIGFLTGQFISNVRPGVVYPTMNYNINLPSVAPSKSADSLIDEFGQCGGLEWDGPKACRTNLICFKRSKYYSQCLSAEAVANATRPAPQVLPDGAKCHGTKFSNPIACAIGTACFIQKENVHGECRTECPIGWFCNEQRLPEWAPCGGEGYVGLTKCRSGLQCVQHSKWYHECRSECPDGWKCTSFY